MHGLQASPFEIGDTYLGSKFELGGDSSLAWGITDTRDRNDVSTFSRGFVNLYLAQRFGVDICSHGGLRGSFVRLAPPFFLD